MLILDSLREQSHMQPLCEGPSLFMQHMVLHPTKPNLKKISSEGLYWSLVIYNGFLALPSTQHNNTFLEFKPWVSFLSQHFCLKCSSSGLRVGQHDQSQAAHKMARKWQRIAAIGRKSFSSQSNSLPLKWTAEHDKDHIHSFQLPILLQFTIL